MAGTQDSDNQDLAGAQVAAMNQPPNTLAAIGLQSPDQLSPDLKTRIKQLTDLQQKKIAEQEAMLKGQLGNISSYAQLPVATDLSPLMAYVDSTTGSNLSKGYHAPATPQDRLAQLSQLENQLLQRKDQLTDDQQKLLQSQIQQLMGESMVGFRGARLGLAQQAQDRRSEDQAFRAGSAFTHDKINTQLQGTMNSLDRAISMLDNKDIPITAKSFAVLQQDMINAMAPGGAATEGKVHRELTEPLAAQLNNLQLKFGDVQDLRPAMPEIVENLRQMMGAVKSDYQEAMQKQAGKIASTYVGSKNPMLKQVVKNKLQEFSAPKADGPSVGDVEDGHKFLGGDPANPSSWQQVGGE